MTASVLSPHLERVKQNAEDFQSKFSMQDNFPRRLDPEDGQRTGISQNDYCGEWYRATTRR